MRIVSESDSEIILAHKWERLNWLFGALMLSVGLLLPVVDIYLLPLTPFLVVLGLLAIGTTRAKIDFNGSEGYITAAYATPLSFWRFRRTKRISPQEAATAYLAVKMQRTLSSFGTQRPTRIHLRYRRGLNQEKNFVLLGTGESDMEVAKNVATRLLGREPEVIERVWRPKRYRPYFFAAGVTSIVVVGWLVLYGGAELVAVWSLVTLAVSPRGTLKKCVNSQAVYPLCEQDGLEAQERGYTAHEEGKH